MHRVSSVVGSICRLTIACDVVGSVSTVGAAHYVINFSHKFIKQRRRDVPINSLPLAAGNSRHIGRHENDANGKLAKTSFFSRSLHFDICVRANANNTPKVVCDVENK